MLATGGPAHEHDRPSELQPVPVPQPPPAVDALPVDVGAVARQAVVNKEELAAELLQLGVEPRDLVVPVDAQRRLRVAADRELAGERGGLEPARPVAVQQEGLVATLGMDHRLKLHRGERARLPIDAVRPHAHPGYPIARATSSARSPRGGGRRGSDAPSGHRPRISDSPRRWSSPSPSGARDGALSHRPRGLRSALGVIASAAPVTSSSQQEGQLAWLQAIRRRCNLRSAVSSATAIMSALPLPAFAAEPGCARRRPSPSARWTGFAAARGSRTGITIAGLTDRARRQHPRVL